MENFQLCRRKVYIGHIYYNFSSIELEEKMNIHLKLEEKIKALTSDFDDSPSVIQRECSTIPCAYLGNTIPKC